MTPAEMRPGIPYIVTRGSGALGLHRGDLLTVRQDGALCRGASCWIAGWSGYSFAVEVDRGGVLERIAALRAEAEALVGLLD